MFVKSQDNGLLTDIAGKSLSFLEFTSGTVALGIEENDLILGEFPDRETANKAMDYICKGIEAKAPIVYLDEV